MRIISGKHKGRRIELLKEASTVIRPTSDYARQAIFNILTHGKHGLESHSFEDKTVLDLFCGTGAFGLEALSRGAKYALFIDQSRDAIHNSRSNAEKMHELESANFMLADASKLGKAQKRFDVVFLDPPYFKKMIEPTLNNLHKGGWIDGESILITERDAKEPITYPESFQTIDERQYGRAIINLLKLK